MGTDDLAQGTGRVKTVQGLHLGLELGSLRLQIWKEVVHVGTGGWEVEALVID